MGYARALTVLFETRTKVLVVGVVGVVVVGTSSGGARCVPFLMGSRMERNVMAACRVECVQRYEP